MGQRGPKPAHETIRALPGAKGHMPTPPGDLTEAQAALWRDIVASEPATMFDSAARCHLLRLYVEHATFRASLQALIGRSPIERLCGEHTGKAFEAMLRARDRETKALVSLATRLRLTNQARYTASAAGSAARNNPGGGPRPWEERDPADEFLG